MVVGTPVVRLTTDEEDFYKARIALRTAEATALVGTIFHRALSRPQKHVQFSQEIFDATKGALIGLLAQMEARLDILVKREASFQERLEQLEGHGLKHCGIWQRPILYNKGSVVSYGGSTWIAVTEVEGAHPGETASWQLMVKRGGSPA